MARINPPKLVNPRNAIFQEELRVLGVPTGRDRTLEAARQKRADIEALKPRVVEGNVKDGTALKALLQRQADKGEIIDETTEGGTYGDEIRHGVFINANTPKLRAEVQASSSTASTTNTVTTVTALAQTYALLDGKWDVFCTGDLTLTNSAGGSSALALEIDGTEDTADVIAAVPAAGDGRYATTFLLGDVAGDRDITIRLRYRSNSGGTTAAKNPRIVTYAERVE